MQLGLTLGVAHHLAKLEWRVAGEDHAEGDAARVSLLQMAAQGVQIGIGEHKHQLALGAGDQLAGVGQGLAPPAEVPEPARLLAVVERQQLGA